MDPKKLIQTLKEQHRDLQARLEILKMLSEANPIHVEIIHTQLEEFKGKLLEHLTYENEQFYTRYIEKLREKGLETDQTTQFVKNMDVIANSVKSILGKYETLERLQESAQFFNSDIQTIIDTITVRIEEEEERFDLFLLP